MVEVIQYQPDPIHFLRFHYSNTVMDQHTLYKSNGSDETSLLDAHEWVEEEFQVTRHQWTAP
jgi:hypothetical protein